MDSNILVATILLIFYVLGFWYLIRNKKSASRLTHRIINVICACMAGALLFDISAYSGESFSEYIRVMPILDITVFLVFIGSVYYLCSNFTRSNRQKIRSYLERKDV